MNDPGSASSTWTGGSSLIRGCLAVARRPQDDIDGQRRLRDSSSAIPPNDTQSGSPEQRVRRHLDPPRTPAGLARPIETTGSWVHVTQDRLWTRFVRKRDGLLDP